ncbi:alpha carbonic anhydrase 7-like isoform X3 [Nymphaea colorata]|nr:alpha carbonic anhydrase 7-like isoform X1 [Nymphaea colorata]XP_049931754.1 alpha carbonic anhydrase 7-like isoform X3 [Nymphaea colorata]
MASFLSVLFVLHALAFLAAYPLLVASQEVEDEKEFDYQKGSVKGPEHWGELHKEWSNCSRGRMQSPIDLLNERVVVLPHLGRLRRTYMPAKGTIKNRGHDIMLKWESGAGAMYINGTEFFLRQLHWHSPSEHTINGRRYDLELHIVHQTEDNQTAVVGILYKIGRQDTFLHQLSDEIKKVIDKKEAEMEAGILDPRGVKIGSRKYYRYLGSLTTPPCTEGVIWTISKKVRTVSREQVKLLRDAVHDNYEANARPVQPANRRPIYFYTPRFNAYVPHV